MVNPYEILGVRREASDEEVRRVYKDLVKKYHPDKYVDNPLRELAEEKLKEINMAYDQIMKEREGKSYSNNSSSYHNQSNYQDPSFLHIRRLIDSNNIQQAEFELSRVSNRNAEWHYLMGLVYIKKGWYNEGLSHIRTALSMDPGNREYAQTMERLNFHNKAYANNSYSRGYRSGPNLCETLQCLICADCCCECMGGDLIRCC